MKKEFWAPFSGILAFFAPFLCCAGPLLALFVGGSAATAATKFTEKYAPVFWLVGVAAIGWSAWMFWKKRRAKNIEIILQSLFTCPNCGFQKTETMPTDACQFFYECENCRVLLKPRPGDCCVFCSFGTVKCPPIQLGEKCCS